MGGVRNSPFASRSSPPSSADPAPSSAAPSLSCPEPSCPGTAGEQLIIGIVTGIVALSPVGLQPPQCPWSWQHLPGFSKELNAFHFSFPPCAFPPGFYSLDCGSSIAPNSAICTPLEVFGTVEVGKTQLSFPQKPRRACPVLLSIPADPSGHRRPRELREEPKVEGGKQLLIQVDPKIHLEAAKPLTWGGRGAAPLRPGDAQRPIRGEKLLLLGAGAPRALREGRGKQMSLLLKLIMDSGA